jgi:RimJ/RimL family protein N-acetyltransferase
VRPTVVLRSDRLELRRLDGGDAALVESLYANAQIALGNVRWRTELPGVATIGYSVVPAFWGQGFGTDLAGLVVEFATGTLGVREVCATTLDGNPASTRVLEKLGFAAVEVGASEVDSRGDERRVTLWFLLRLSRPSGPPNYRLKRIGSTPTLSLSVSPMGLISSP